MTCKQCKAEEVETRPYGPGRTEICENCVCSNPEWEAIARMYAREAEADRRKAALEALKAANPTVIFIEIPSGLVQDALAQPPNQPCNCPSCSAKRKSAN